MARQSEESSMLKAVSSERLMKTQQTRKKLCDAVVICELWRLAAAL
jgi:hypothetical protein